MVLWKNGCRRQNINVKDGGQVEWVMGFFSLIILGILLCAEIQIGVWRTSNLYLEDALAASNLAAAQIDIREYGRSHRVQIADASAAYAVYCEAVKENLQLDNNWICGNRGLISGRVEVVDFIVYNVVGNAVTAIRVDPSGMVQEIWSGARGSLKAPNGKLVECTGIYSEITFPVEGLFGMTVQAHKGNLADIWSDNQEGGT